MTKKILILLALSVLVPASLDAKKPVDRDTTGLIMGFEPEFLDTVEIHPFKLNNYWMVGFEYGPALNGMYFNPEYKQKRFLSNPGYYGFTITKYGKMFGYMPYFGLQLGIFRGTEGFLFAEDKERGYTYQIQGATQVKYDVIEVPFLLEGHYDAQHFKLMLDAGPYAGYRLGIERIGDEVPESDVNLFYDTDHRFDYGLGFGAGFGLVFNPLEFHIKLRSRMSWSNLFDPDYYSEYYYKFATPLDFMITAGIYLQLSKRSGKTKPMLKREAREEAKRRANGNN